MLMLYKGGLWDGCLTWTGGFACVGGSYVNMNRGESLDMFSTFKKLCIKSIEKILFDKLYTNIRFYYHT